MTDVHDGFLRQGLVRPREDRILASVCAGWAGASASTRGRSG
jgi:hypothetical protein